MLVPKFGQGKAIVLLSGVLHKQPKLNDLTNLEPLITKEIRLQWLAKLNPKNDTYQKLKENILKRDFIK